MVVLAQKLQVLTDLTQHGLSRLMPNLSQTKGLVPGQTVMPKELTRERFLMPYHSAMLSL